MNRDKNHEALAAWLATPAAYPHAPARVECVETHISRVFLAGELVYKLKKPVCFDFVDFSTVEKRAFACREELRLNRRLAPDAYLDVVPVVRGADGSFQLGGSGEPVDWLVKMRRLPVDQSLLGLHERGELQHEHIDRLALTLAAFYRSLPRLDITPADYRARVEAHVRGNQRELLAWRQQLPWGMAERVHAFQLQLLRLRPGLFDERVRDGRIVDGHGDLRPEHICLTDPPVIFDCIEFSADLRQADLADELCFLASECDFLGAGWAGVRLLDQYQDNTGDRVPAMLLDFYKSYRACVRAKVALLRESQLAPLQRPAAADEAAQHLAWADRYSQPWNRPLLIVVGGLSGTGKTTLAAEVADLLGAALLRTDVVRQEAIGDGVDADERYSPAGRQRVYDELLARARQMHGEGLSVVLDGTFASGALVRAAQGACVHPLGLFLAVECVCPPDLARQRIAARLAAGGDASEARPETYEQQRQSWEAWPADLDWCRVETERPLSEQVASILGALQSLWRRELAKE